MDQLDLSFWRQNMLFGLRRTEIIFVIWSVLALAILLPVTLLLKSSFPIFTVLWILVPLIVVLIKKEASRVGFRLISWRELVQATAINLGGLLLVMLAFEPWSHTYQKLLEATLSSQAPDATFAWLLRFQRIPALGGMFLFSGMVTLFGEELFFRGWLLQNLIKRWGITWAIIIQALLFVIPNLLAALVLPPLQGVLYVLVYTWLAIGLIGGWAASRTGSIWPSLVSATVCNLVLVVLIV
jgi:membrane protease YdiL (CAAX protease family)